MCNKEVHELLIQEDYVNCVFCNKQIQDPGKPKRYFCCDSMKLIKDNLLVCKNCGQVHDYLTADEYVDFYENRYRIKRKSVYHRKYHIINVMDNIAQTNGSVNFIIKQLFDILGVEYKIIPLTQIKNTLRYYEVWWEKVYGLIKTDVDRLLSQNLERN